jgi:hypothetical protein
VQYVLTDPATRFASCSCPVATQHKPCKHQVAWLLSLAPAERKADAERLVLSRLGTLLGFAGGCSMESISELSVALKNLLPLAPNLSVSEPAAAAAPPPAAALGAAAEHEEGSDVAPGSSDSRVPAPPAARLLGPLALHNHRRELHALLEECLGALDKVAPNMQHSLALQQKALLVRARDVSVLAASTAHEVRENFASAADVTYKRHKSALEHPARRVKSRATKQPEQALLQQDFANVRRDESLLVSRAFRGGRSAKQAAEHVQRCMNTARQDTGAPGPITPHEEPLQRSPLQQQQQHQLQQNHHQPHEPRGVPQQLQPQRRPPPQQQEQTASMAPCGMPRQPFDLLHSFLMQKDSRRLTAAAAAGVVVPRSMLAFTPQQQQQQQQQQHQPPQSLSLQPVPLQQQQQLLGQPLQHQLLQQQSPQPLPQWCPPELPGCDGNV